MGGVQVGGRRGGVVGCGGGFTLVEMVVALSIVGLILGSLVSGMLFVSSGLPRDDGPGEVGGRVAGLMGALREDVAFAVSVDGLGADRLSLTVPDRDGDGVGESIEYAWDGIGGVLERRRGGARTHGLGGVVAFGLEGRLVPGDDAAFGGDAVMFVEYGEDVPLPLPLAVGLGDDRVASGVAVSLGGLTQSWTVDRVDVAMLDDGSGPNVAAPVFARVFAAGGGGQPIGDALGSASLSSSELGASSAVESFVFDPPVILAAGADVTVVFESANGGVALPLSVDLDGEPDALVDVDSNGSWFSVLSSLRMRVYGRETDEVVAAEALAGVVLEMDVGGVGVVRGGATAMSAAPVVP